MAPLGKIFAVALFVSSFICVPIIAVEWHDWAAGAGIIFFYGFSYEVKRSFDLVCPTGFVKEVANNESEGRSTSGWQWGCVGYYTGSILLKTLAATCAMKVGVTGWQSVSVTTTESNDEKAKRNNANIYYYGTTNHSITITDEYMSGLFEEDLVKRDEQSEWQLFDYGYFVQGHGDNHSAIAHATLGNYSQYPATFSYKHSNGTVIVTAADKDNIGAAHDYFKSWSKGENIELKKRENINWMSCTVNGLLVQESELLVIADYVDNAGG